MYLCVCVFVSVFFKWHLSFAFFEQRREKHGKIGYIVCPVMQSRNPITKLTSFWYVQLIHFRCTYKHNFKTYILNLQHIWFDCKYIKYIDLAPKWWWCYWCYFVDAFPKLKWLLCYQVLLSSACSHFIQRCIGPISFLFLFSYNFNRLHFQYTSFSENDHITLYLNMIRVDYRSVCSAWNLMLAPITIYCCIPFSILCPKNTNHFNAIIRFVLNIHLTQHFLVEFISKYFNGLIFLASAS